MNPVRRKPPQAYHISMGVRREPLAFSPVDRFFIPDTSVEGLFLLYLAKAENHRRNFQVNYIGKLKPFSAQAIENQVFRERESRSYHNLDDAVEALKPRLYLNEPIPFTENQDVLILYNPDEKGYPRLHDLSVITFGLRFPLDKEGTKLQIRYAGGFNVSKLSDLTNLPEEYHLLIRTGVNQINESLRRRFEELGRKRIRYHSLHDNQDIGKPETEDDNNRGLEK